MRFLLNILTISVFLFTVSACDYATHDSIAGYSVYDEFTNNFSVAHDDTTSFFIDNSHPALINLRKRAHLIADIEWYALGDVPKLDGFFAADHTYTGIPYSSVKELNKYVGQEVSFYTFLSAVKNPRSVLYTDRVSEYPYNGVNCASYYGSVCSMTINYALGFDRPYNSIMYGALPFIKRVVDQNFRSIRPGDIVWKEGHVLLVIDVDYDDNGMVTRIEILENNGYCAFIESYTLNEFEKRWEGIEWVIYRNVELYKLADESGLQVIPEDEFIDNLTFNPDLSLDRGDKVTYREGEDVRVNVLSDNYSILELYESGKLISRQSYTGTPDVVYSGLPYGHYEARLSDKSKFSTPIYFEILQTKVDVQVKKDMVTINFHSDNAVPEYLVFCDEKGGIYFISDITQEDRFNGFKTIKVSASLDRRYVKVFYRGNYGRVSNYMIPLVSK